MWTFQITTGRMLDPEGVLAGEGYAGGNLGTVPEAINNPIFEPVHNIGPLPEGFYTFGDLVVKHPTLGSYVFPLIPDASNQMYGRSGFYCHGDTPTPRHASEGCIVMPYSTRQMMNNSKDRRLQVISGLGLTDPARLEGL